MKKDLNNQSPRARKDQLIIKELPDETLVYDLANDKAHCLNDTAAMVWKNCDGEKSVGEINALLAEEAGAPVDEGVVWLALDQLEKFKLLAEVPTAPAVFAGMSRRQLMRNLGVAAIALPVVVSIISPTPTQAASCGRACNSPADCTTPPFTSSCPSCNPNPGPGKSCGA
jgi:hypothetical protein